MSALEGLGGHHVVGAAVGLAGDHGQLGHGGLGVGVQQLGPVADDAAPLLAGAGHEPGHVDEADDGDVEGVAEAHEAGALDRGVDVQDPGQVQRLVADDPHRPAVEPGQADHHRLGVGLEDLQELAVVDHPGDHLADVVRLVGVVGDQVDQRLLLPPGVVGGLAPGRVLHVVEGQEADQLAGQVEALVLVLGGEVGRARLGGVGHGPAQLLEGHVLAGHRLHHVRAGDEHVGGLLDHQHEVGDGRGVDGAAGRGAHDQRQLGDHPGGLDVAPEDLGVARQGDARPPGCGPRRSR